jgi:peptidyl-prolyl cis-trans isomerase C
MSYDAPAELPLEFAAEFPCKGSSMIARPRPGLRPGLFLGVLLAAAVPATVLAQAAAAKAATVNGKAIPKSRVDFVMKQQAAQGAPDNEQVRKLVLDRLINIEIVVQEADRKGLTKNLEVQTQLELARQQLVFQSFLQDYFKSRPITDEAARTEYERIKAQRGDKEYKARHILVEKDAEAKDIIEQLKKGGNFADLAKASKDIGSRDRGGALEWEIPGNYAKPFADALIKLEKGKYTEAPVQSPFGWHVILLEDERPLPIPSFDDVKQQVYGGLQEQEVQRIIKDLRAKAKVE